MSWEAIRALPEPIVGENEWWDYFDGDLFMAPSEQPRFWQVLQAAHEAQVLLKEHDRAVELLRQLRGIIHHELDPAKDSGYYVYDPEGIVEIEIDPFLRKLSGSTELRRDMEGE